MTTFLKMVLTVAVMAFLASLTEAGSAIAWGFLKPLGAVLFIVFFIGQLLHKEVVKYDEECRSQMALAKQPQAAPSLPQRVRSTAPRAQNKPSFASVN